MAIFLLLNLMVIAFLFEYFLEGFKKYAVFSGRANVKEWWGFHGAVISICFAILAATYIQDFDVENVEGFFLIFKVVVLIPSISLTCRRLHDIGLSGWLFLLGIVPILGSLFLLVCSLIVGNKEENSYGKPSTFGKK